MRKVVAYLLSSVDGVVDTLDLVDELRLLVFPVIAGNGRRLFQQGLETKHLKLIQNKCSPLGILRLAYAFERTVS